MADPQFFTRAAPQKLGELALIGGATLSDNADPERVVEDVAPLDQATPLELSFLDNPRYREQFKITRCGACVVNPAMASLAPGGLPLLLSNNPYKTYALIAQSFYPEAWPQTSIAASAHIADDVVMGEGATIEDNAVIRSGARIGAGCWIGANAVVGVNVRLGERCRIGANAVVSHAIIGNNVRIYPGCCIGQDGFGFAIDPAGFVKVPQLGRVVIEDSVEIGANTTIDRGAGPDTVIGQGTWIDNLVQIGHNVRIGRGCVIVSQVGISGSTVVEDYAMLAGQAGIAGHLRIGKGARVGAKAGVMRDVPAGETILGSPAVPVKQFMRQVAAVTKLLDRDKEKK